jgi:hypothetical protein
MGRKPLETVYKDGKKMLVGEYVRTELEELEREARRFLNLLSNIETELSSLLHAILNSKKSKVPQAIFFSVNSFDGRVNIVENALLEAISENRRLKRLGTKRIWPYIAEKIGDARNLRNAIAHGVPQTWIIRDKYYVRWMAPIGDVIRIDRALARRQIPGIATADLVQGFAPLPHIILCVEAISEIVSASRRPRNRALREKFVRLEGRLTALRSLYSVVPKKLKSSRQPQPSSASRRKEAMRRAGRS